VSPGVGSGRTEGGGEGYPCAAPGSCVRRRSPHSFTRAEVLSARSAALGGGAGARPVGAGAGLYVSRLSFRELGGVSTSSAASHACVDPDEADMNAVSEPAERLDAVGMLRERLP
jgi:hypothetical protein